MNKFIHIKGSYANNKEIKDIDINVDSINYIHSYRISLNSKITILLEEPYTKETVINLIENSDYKYKFTNVAENYYESNIYINLNNIEIISYDDKDSCLVMFKNGEGIYVKNSFEKLNNLINTY